MRHAWLSLLLVLAPAASLAQAPAPPLAPLPTAQQPIQIPPPPQTDDPMLEPVPPATHTIASWDNALMYIRSRSVDLRIANLEVTRAEAQSRTALAGLLPSLNGNVVGAHQFITTPIPSSQGAIVPIGFFGKNLDQTQNPPAPVPLGFSSGGDFPTPNTLSASLSLVQPIIAVRTWNGLKTASINEEVNHLSVDDVKRNIALIVANSIVAVLTSERVAELNRNGFRSALQRLSLAQRKQSLGAARGLDVIRAQQDVESARGTLVTGDESLLQAREALGLALGVAEPIGVAPGVDLNGLAAATLASCRAAPLDDRPDIAAARKRIELAHQGVKDVDAQFFPTLNAQSTLFDSTAGNAVTSASSWNIQAVLNWNIWDGGARYGALRDQRAQEEEARQRLESSHRQAEIQVEQARRGVEVAERSRKVSDDARALAAETDRLTQAGYLEGQGSSLELVTAASALRQADISLALAEFTLVKAKILAVLSLATCPW